MSDFIVYKDECGGNRVYCEVLSDYQSSIYNAEKWLIDNGYIITCAEMFNGSYLIVAHKKEEEKVLQGRKQE